MKKGFTLVELLAVIVILGALALIIVPNVAGTLKNQKNNLYKVQISNIEDAAQGWASENFFSLPTEDNATITIYLKDLVGLIDTDITNPKTNEKFGQCLAIEITKVKGTENYTYEVLEDTINNNGDCKSNIITDNSNKDNNNAQEEVLVTNGVVPEGGTYYVGVTSSTLGDYTGATAIYNSGDTFPANVSDGDVFVFGDYEYRYNYKYTGSAKWIQNTEQKGWSVRVLDNTKSMYGEPYSIINNKYITSTSCMFRNCSNLTTLNLSNFDTSNVTDMEYMFDGCSSLATLNVSNFDTSNVTTMWMMFSECNSLTSLNVSNFDTSKVTSMYSMFSGCNSLTTLDLSNFNTSKVTNMRSMFDGCNSLTTLNLSNFDTSNVKSMKYMFDGANVLSSIKVKNETEKTRLSSSDTYLNSTCTITVVG